MNIFTKFHRERTKIVDFLLIAKCVDCELFFLAPYFLFFVSGMVVPSDRVILKQLSIDKLISIPGLLVTPKIKDIRNITDEFAIYNSEKFQDKEKIPRVYDLHPCDLIRKND